MLSIISALFALSTPPSTPPRNVILMIADGTGFNQYAAAAIAEGHYGKEVFDGKGWIKLAMSTYPLNEGGKPSFSGLQTDKVAYTPAKGWNRDDHYQWLKETPTDSAAAATAFATGQKTYHGGICWSDLDKPLVNINDVYRAAGKSVGVVTSVEWSDATPAGMIAHNVTRAAHAAIAQEMVERSGATVVMGACHPWYDGSGKRLSKIGDASWVGEKDYFTTPVEAWNGIRFIESKADFEALAAGKLDMKGCDRLVGTAQVASGLQIQRATQDWNHDGKIDGADYKVAPLHGDPKNATVPELATMAEGALNLLSQNQKGFFLMIEGGAIDHAGHNNWPARMVEEGQDFFRAVEFVDRWVKKHGGWKENLVIVTADHETGCVYGPESDTKPFQEIVDRGKGVTPGFRFNSGGHTNALVPFYVRGAGAEQFLQMATSKDPVRGAYVDNTDVFKIAVQSAR